MADPTQIGASQNIVEQKLSADTQRKTTSSKNAGRMWNILVKSKTGKEILNKIRNISTENNITSLQDNIESLADLRNKHIEYLGKKIFSTIHIIFSRIFGVIKRVDKKIKELESKKIKELKQQYQNGMQQAVKSFQETIGHERINTLLEPEYMYSHLKNGKTGCFAVVKSKYEPAICNIFFNVDPKEFPTSTIRTKITEKGFKTIPTEHIVASLDLNQTIRGNTLAELMENIKKHIFAPKGIDMKPLDLSLLKKRCCQKAFEPILKTCLDSATQFQQLHAEVAKLTEKRKSYPKKEVFTSLLNKLEDSNTKEGDTPVKTKRHVFLTNLQTAMKTNGSLSSIPESIVSELKTMVNNELIRVGSSSKKKHPDVSTTVLDRIKEELTQLNTTTRDEISTEINTKMSSITSLKTTVSEAIQRLVKTHGAALVNTLLEEKQFVGIKEAMNLFYIKINLE